jgi:hypothetical protein
MSRFSRRRANHAWGCGGLRAVGHEAVDLSHYKATDLSRRRSAQQSAEVRTRSPPDRGAGGPLRLQKRLEPHRLPAADEKSRPAEASPTPRDRWRPFLVPACDAAKFRCPKRRTLSSTARQSIWSQSSVSPCGPFAATLVVASNLSFSSGVVVTSSSRAHPIASAPLRAEPPGPVSGR